MNAHVSLGFKKDKDPQLIPFAQGVHDGLGANSTVFTNLPVTLLVLLAALTDFTTKFNASIKGSVAQTQAKDAARVVLIGLLSQLAAYVEGVAQGDAEIIRKAGFAVASHEHAPQVPLNKPVIDGTESPESTKVQLRVKKQPNVHSVRVQYRSANGAWLEGGTFSSTKLIIIPNLVPGTFYEFRVQFIGGSTGASEWSDFVSHMST